MRLSGYINKGRRVGTRQVDSGSVADVEGKIPRESEGLVAANANLDGTLRPNCGARSRVSPALVYEYYRPCVTTL